MFDIVRNVHTPARTFPYTTFVRDAFGNEAPQYTYVDATTRYVGGNPNHVQTWGAVGDSGAWADTPGMGYHAHPRMFPDLPESGEKRTITPLSEGEKARRLADAEYRARTEPLPPKSRGTRSQSPNRVVYGQLPPPLSLSGTPRTGDIVVDSCYADVSQFDADTIRRGVYSACRKGFARYYTRFRVCPKSGMMVRQRAKGFHPLPESWWGDVYQSTLVWVIEQMANNRRIMDEATRTGTEPKVLDANDPTRMGGWIRKAEQLANVIIPIDPRIVGAVARRMIQTQTGQTTTLGVPEVGEASRIDPDGPRIDTGSPIGVPLEQVVRNLFATNPALGDAVWELFTTRAAVAGCVKPRELSPDDVARRYGVARSTLFKGLNRVSDLIGELQSDNLVRIEDPIVKRRKAS